MIHALGQVARESAYRATHAVSHKRLHLLDTGEK